MAPNSIHWFRKGLRLHDNPALREAVRGAGTVRCVYFLDPWFAGSSNLGVNRWRFLLQCLEDLDASLRKLNSRLFVVRGQPANVFPRLFKEWKISRLTFEYDSEPFGKERDAAIKKLAMEAGVEVCVKTSHTLYDLDRVIELNGGQPPLTYKRFQTLISRMDPPSPLQVRRALAGRARVRHGRPPICRVAGGRDGGPDQDREAPREEGLGGQLRETQNERQLAAGQPHRPQPLPALRLSVLPPLLLQTHRSLPQGEEEQLPPLSLYGQLLWREFFYTAATTNPRFDKMEGNPICVRIPWDRNPEALAKWAEAKTGFPWIDAIMTQLRQEGWIHHLARHAVACFLTRGDLWISWEEGMKVFEELLLDADWSVNAGSWMWLSCSSFFQQFFHCYCPVGFGRRTDPNGDFIRRYLPVLRGFPAKYIYDPWNAPDSVQAAAKCIIGIHYPKPMVNHAEASRLNIERMKQIYQQLSRYRGLGLLASVPTNHNGNGNGAMMAYSPGEQQTGTSATATTGVSGSKVASGNGSGSILLNFDSEDQPRPSRVQQHGFPTVADPAHRLQQPGSAHEFAVPQHPGRLSHPGGRGSWSRNVSLEGKMKHGAPHAKYHDKTLRGARVCRRIGPHLTKSLLSTDARRTRKTQIHKIHFSTLILLRIFAFLILCRLCIQFLKIQPFVPHVNLEKISRSHSKV
ncbi:hypothetical protein ANANG_G00217150 [Anguilla anguilla]|uniref:Photolyase/cryptochrome alpha/beta domain-containing protein n=1 Tax=Anguilla anguilla TaxID=7936 RepID=A0A9D3LVN0_ANGAN|nr:hypothetical protein ANANG_G00217150 [Anguilla anguilla]